MELTIDYEHDYNSMLRFVKLHYKARQKGLRITNLVVLVCLAVSVGGLIIVNTMFDTWDFPSILIIILGTVVSVSILFRPQIIAFMNVKRTVKKVGTMNIRFTDDSVKVATGIGREEYIYSAICDLFFYENTLYAYIDKNHALIFPESGVKNGSIRDLCSFLSAKTGVEIKTIQ